MRAFLFSGCAPALVLAMALAPLQAQAQELHITPGFQRLLDKSPELIGIPLEDEHPGDVPDSTVVRTSTGLAYWQPGLLPSWTDGHQRATLDGDDLVQWVGEVLSPPLPEVYASAMPDKWVRRAACESGGNWRANTGNTYYGGLQENMQFWIGYGGLAFAPRPDLATPGEQLIVAERGEAVQGPGAWPVCSYVSRLR